MPYRIVIIGGGHSAMILIDVLNDLMDGTPDAKSMLPLEIEILEAKQEMDGGVAWSKNSARPFHLANTYFLNQQQRLRHKQRFFELGLDYPAPNQQANKYEVPRIINHQVTLINYGKTVKNLEKLGVKLHVSYNSKAVRVDKTSGTYKVQTEKGDTFEADSLVLSGHWRGKSSMQENPGVFASPWPASDIETGVDLQQKTAIMGSSLDAVDAALTLAHAAGTFEPATDEKGNIKKDFLTFKPKPGFENFSLTMFSPSGLLPNVKGIDTGQTVFEMKHLDSNSLEEVFQKIRRDFVKFHVKYRPPTWKHIRSMDGICNFLLDSVFNHRLKNDEELAAMLEILKKEHLSLDETLGMLHDYYQSQNMLEHFTKNYEAASRSLASLTPVPAQQYVHNITTLLEACYRDFSAEDQERFMRDIRPVLVKYAIGAMAHSSGKHIQALLASGHLKVQALGPHSSLGTVQDGQGANKRGGEIRYTDKSGKEHHEYFPSVVKAYGDVPGQLRTSSPLMKDLFEKGLVREMLTPFADQVRGAQEFDQQRQKAEPGNIREINGRYYRSGGVLQLNPESYEAETGDPSAAKEPTNIYALGPLAIGQKPLLQGIDAINDCSHRIWKNIGLRILQSRTLRPYNMAPDDPSRFVEVSEDDYRVILQSGISDVVVLVAEEMSQDTREALRRQIAAKTRRPLEYVSVADVNNIPAATKEILNQRSNSNPFRGI